MRTFVPLAHVADSPCSQVHLGSRLMVDPAATVDVVVDLEASGALRWVRNPCDRRSCTLEVTPEGERLRRQAGAAMAEATAELTAGLDGRWARELLGLLAGISRSVGRERARGLRTRTAAARPARGGLSDGCRHGADTTGSAFRPGAAR